MQGNLKKQQPKRSETGAKSRRRGKETMNELPKEENGQQKAREQNEQKEQKTGKKMVLNVVAPMTGRSIPLSEVEEPAFSEQLVGEGVAIVPSSGTVRAPVTGTLERVFSTNHAFSVRTNEGREVLVHVGMGTAELDGRGFTRLRQPGERVTVGQVVLKADLDVLEGLGKSLLSPVVLVDAENVERIELMEGPVEGGSTTIMIAAFHPLPPAPEGSGAQGISPA